MANIKRIIKKTTKKEFLQHVDERNYCPCEYNFDYEEPGCKAGDISTCKDCWNNALRDFRFKDED